MFDHNTILVTWSILTIGLLMMISISGFGLYQYLFGPPAIRKLVNTYIFKRRIGWMSVIAITLCTAMVLVVISVMGGWLETFKQKFRGISGDIVIYRLQPPSGFAGYEQMLEVIKSDPDVEEALPLIRSMGLLNILNQNIQGVQVTGFDIAKFSKFNNFRQSLWRQYQKKIAQGETPDPVANFDLLSSIPYEAFRPDDRRALQRPGMIVGGPLIGFHKNEDGKVKEPDGAFSYWARLEVVPIEPGFRSLQDSQPVANIYWIVDASLTQLYQIDEASVYVPFDVLQSDLKMTSRTVFENGREVVLPARCSEIQIKVKPGADRQAVIARLKPALVEIAEANTTGFRSELRVETWEKQREKFLGAVENEKLLVTILFGVISIVAVFLIFCILYMIVVEKTRDIGIIKSVGTTSRQVAAVFIGYGLAIGVVGAGCGWLVGYFFLKYINEIHNSIAYVTKFRMWDPTVYAFDRIPNTMDPFTAVVVVSAAILSAVAGAILPAVRAATLNPIEALRFE